jgi:hypothetical protein
MAQIYNVRGAEREVIETCNLFLQVVGHDPKMQAAALNLRGLGAWNMGRRDGDPKKYADAETSSRRALDIEPGMVVLHYNVGMILLAQGRDEQGLGELKIYLEKDPQGQYGATARRHRRSRLAAASRPRFGGRRIRRARVSEVPGH